MGRVEMGRVGVLDYAAGNLTSVKTALKRLGADYTVSGKPEELEACERLIFPGVGEARAAMGELKRRGLDALLRRFAESGRPVLGICIGCQIMLTRSEENDTSCLDLLPGEVLRFPEGSVREDAEGRDTVLRATANEEITERSKTARLKVPHMGWNEVRFSKPSPLFDGIPDGSSFYFVHSYYPSPKREEDLLTVTDYGIEFVSAYSRGNLYAVQFHPEKSGEWGIMLLSNFLRIDSGDSGARGEKEGR